MNVAQLFNEKDKFAQFVGIKVIKAENGYSEAIVDLKDIHKNGLGIAHGGLIFTLADLAFAAASNSYGRRAVAIEVSISYIRSVSEGTLRAVAEEIERGKRLGRYLIKVYNDKNNREICALFKGTAFYIDNQ